jgi:alkylation response protein AidB-like acyl-CoA dehydrogenase
MRDHPDLQAAVAASDAAISSARMHLYSQAGQLWHLAAEQRAFQEADVASVFAASWHATRTVSEVVDALYSLAGTSAIYQDNPLERSSRDLRVMRQHVLTQPLWPEQAGRVRLGLNADNPLFMV